MADFYPAYPPSLTPEQESYLITNAKDYSIAHGLAVRPPTSDALKQQDPAGILATTAPITLFPSLFPKVCFEQAKSVAQAYNELYSGIASDEGWLTEIVEELARIDDFMAGLWKVHQAVKSEGYAQPLDLGLFRSDYMVHLDKSTGRGQPSVKQVEFNTIASSFGGLSNRVSEMHQHLASIDAYPEEIGSIVNNSSLPPNTSIPSLALGLAKAHEAYGASSKQLPTCVIFLVQDPERNVFDQRHVEYNLNKTHNIRTFRLPFDRVLQDTTLDSDRKLIYTPPSMPSRRFEVTVVYFRAGYAPSEYTTSAHWDGRLHLERSAAIKCPSVLTQLAGTKKVQQVLATPHSPHLSRFIHNSAAAQSLLSTFAPIYPLDSTSSAGQEARRLATDPRTAAAYVLKPQREGGGNNIYRRAIPAFLQNLPESQWPAYILMEMIEPPAQRNAIFRFGGEESVQTGGVICELGIYGVCLWERPAAVVGGEGQSGSDARRPVIRENFEAGYLLRTKGDQSEEGGVAAGFGCVDSPCLVEV
jgi:glutathione synthase